MKKLLTFLAITTSIIFANYQAKISKITPQIEKRMRDGGSYKDYCPISLNDLRYIKLKYIGFDGKEHWGELIVNRAVVNDVVAIFRELYNIKYPIKQMRLVSDFKASDFASIEADNTSAFNCRKASGSKNWSRHSFGKAIDINPIENPYIYLNGKTVHKKSIKYLNRKHIKNRKNDKAIIIKGDEIIKIFKSKGWRWGGTFLEAKDTQHFHKE